MSELEKFYIDRGLTDYKFRDNNDLRTILNISFDSVSGYEGLDNINKEIYRKFIINFFNALDLEARTSIYISGIYYAEEKKYLAKELETQYFTIVGEIVSYIDKNGDKVVLYKRLKDNKRNSSFVIIESEPIYYLRAEYMYKGQKGWFNVIKEGKEWY